MTQKTWRTKALSATLLAFMTCSIGQPAVSMAQTPKHTFTIGESDFLLDGQRLQIRCGEIHFARVPPEYWRHRLKMCKAMGLNAVCAYLFWNQHEWEQGKYDWTGPADAAAFIRMAQEEGLWVILRPGPYACAEWEMGGLPWWLLKNDNLRLRSSDPRFLKPATDYLKEVGRVLGPLQVTRGGPLLMVQVENEYGSYDRDAEYMGALRQALLDGGFDVPLFACNPPGAINRGFREDLFQVVNFGVGGAKGAFETLRRFQKTGPLMNGEYYPGWFDTWGNRHRTGDVERYRADLDYMLTNNHSFSIYMAHGGTSFGFWSGADRPFQPDTSSYDYDAPISEAGWRTPKFEASREVMAKHLLPGERLPDAPAKNPVISVPPFELKESASVFAGLSQPRTDATPKTMEFYDQSRGCTVYRTTLPAGPAASLSVKAAHDYAWIFLDGKNAGVMDRRARRYRVQLPARSAPQQLDILIEAVGRVNFGGEVFDRKGLHAPVNLTVAGSPEQELKDWQIFALPLDDKQLASLDFKPEKATGPAFWRGSFELTQTGDTFLDVRQWGKGVLWVNGHCLGRFWNIGPTQTMYCPGPWLRTGRNDVVVLDVLGPASPTLGGLELPILDEVRPELDFSRKVRATGTFAVDDASAAHRAAFTPEVQWQEANFAKPMTGRFVCFQADSVHNQNDRSPATVAELDLLDARGETLSKANWKILWTDSEETGSESGDGENVLDGQPNTIWTTRTSGRPRPPFPHRLVIDLGESQAVAGIRYLPRGGDPNQPGRVNDYRVFVAEQPFGLKP
ncbi:MAG TPA: beta-galactosidase [Tepidisphaeraceae bacterium]